MNLSDLKQSKFLKKEDVANPVLVTISRIAQENVASEGQEPDAKCVVYFQELDKPMVLNSTNGQIIARIAGVDTNIERSWIGTRIVLFNDPNVSYGGKLVGGIRVRAPKGTVVKATVPKQDQTTFSDGSPVPDDDGMPF